VEYVRETTTQSPAAAPGSAAPPSPAPQGASHAERDTRARVARLILEHGPVSASNLGERLGLTPAAVRRHLDALLAEDLIEVRRARPQAHRGRGRPAKLFAITDAGRSTFVHAYDDLATSALRFLAETAGEEAVAEFARRKISDLERRLAPVVRAAPPQQRARVLAEALSGDGYAASASEAPGRGPLAGGQQLCQQHCPVEHVAAEFPQLCEAETEAFGRLLGTPVQRLATIAHGDGVCTTHVSPGAPAEPATAEPAGGAKGRPSAPESEDDEKSGRTSL
jgi:predicted ArsR family transcriptional regulator